MADQQIHDALILKEVQLNDPFLLQREKLRSKILSASPRLLVTAPPGAGKTTLARLLQHQLQQEGRSVRLIALPRSYSPAYISRMQKKPHEWLDEQFANDEVKTHREALQKYDVILVDDAQGMYSAPEAWNMLAKSSEVVRIIFFASILPESCSDSTPEITERLGWLDLKLDTEEQDDLCVRLMAQYELEWLKEILPMVRRDAGGHVGLLRLISQCLVKEYLADTSNPVELLTHLQRCYFGSMIDSWLAHHFFRHNMRLNADHQKILQNMVGRGKVTAPLLRISNDALDSVEVKAKRELLRMVVVAQEGPNLQFATPLHFRYFFRNAFPSSISEREFQDGGLMNFETWLPRVVGHFRQVDFLGIEFPVEAAIHHFFWRAASECLPSRYRLVAEVSKTMGKEAEGRLDFWINSDLQWAIELVREGNRQQEHFDRFGEDGKYYALQPKEWRVVDFRNPSTKLGALQGRTTSLMSSSKKVSLMLLS